MVTSERGPTSTRRSDGERFLGVDVGGTSIKWSVLRAGVLEASGSVATPRVDQHAVVKAVAALVDSQEGLAGVGLAVPGTVDPVRRSTILVPNLPGDWNNFGVAGELEQLCGLPVGCLNDARAFAWAEHTSGSAQGVSNALFITLGTGVGGAIAFRDEILVGKLDSVGEMGHVPIDARGELCMCGGRGCLETVASGTAIVSRLSRTVALDQSPILRELTQHGAVPLTAQIAAEAARLGDPWAKEAFDRAGDALGQAASMIGLLLQLEVVVIGGGLGPATDLFLPQVQQTLDARTSLTGRIEARRARYGTEAGSIGAANFAAEHATSTPTETPKERILP